MIWELDGMAQHYPILVQLRHMILSFLHNPSGGFTHWAWNISLGSDQLTNLHDIATLQNTEQLIR